MNGQALPDLAPCGVWCGACPSYQKSCLGCASEEHDQGRRSKWGCKIRVCCYEKKELDYCMNCQEFPCKEHNKKLIGSHPGDERFRYRHEIPENFRMLKKLGTERYIGYQTKRFTCPDCGGRVSWYHYTCSECGKKTSIENTLTQYRKYGKAPFGTVLLHGGPGAVGDLGDLAKTLSSNLGVLEALQTRFSIEELIEEASEVITAQTRVPVALVGHSWGAWLGILTAQKHPELIRKLILISSGPFEKSYVKEIMQIRIERLDVEERVTLSSLLDQIKVDSTDKNALFGNIGEILTRADIYEPLEETQSEVEFNYTQYESIWPSAARLRDSGKLLQSLEQITCPVVALHGDYDPHPAAGVRDPLLERLNDFRFYLLEHCGHYPWREKSAAEKFYEVILGELKD